MALNIKNTEVERLAAEVASMSRVSKTEAIKVALQERKEKLVSDRSHRIHETLEWLRNSVWAKAPAEARRRLTKEEEERLLGFDSDGR